ncbi:MAG: hypothetical protein ACJASC_001461 [Limimaricola cinnabarinus]|jgi:hypothetical protein
MRNAAEAMKQVNGRLATAARLSVAPMMDRRTQRDFLILKADAILAVMM